MFASILPMERTLGYPNRIFKLSDVAVVENIIVLKFYYIKRFAWP